MDDNTKAELKRAWEEALPSECRTPPATEEQLLHFESAFGPIPSDFRWFLAECGGGPAGGDWVDGIEALSETHAKFTRESGPNGWTLADTFIIGWDGGGNPFGIHRPTGVILVEDHQFGGIHEIALSLEALLRRSL